MRWLLVAACLFSASAATGQTEEPPIPRIDYEIDLGGVTTGLLEGQLAGVVQRLDEAGYPITWEALDATHIAVTVSGGSAGQGALFAAMSSASGRFMPTEQSGDVITFQWTPVETFGDSEIREAVRGVLQSRAASTGCPSAVLSPSDGSLRVVPECETPDLGAIRAAIERPATLRIAPLLNNGSWDESRAVTEANLVSVAAGFDEWSYTPRVDLSLDEAGTTRLCEVTAEILDKELAIVVDGEIVSQPRVMEAICGGRASITLEYGEPLADAELLSILLRGLPPVRHVATVEE